MHLIRQPWQLLLSFVIVTSLSGCAMIFTHSTNAVIRSSDRGVSISCEGSANRVSGTDSIRIRLSNGWDDYIVTAQKDGYLTYTAPLIRNRFNGVKLVDVAVPLVAGMYAIAHMNDEVSTAADETITPAAFFTGTLGWLVLFSGEWRLYPKSHTLPPLKPAPRRADDESPVVLSRVSMDVASGASSRTYFDDFMAYDKGKSMYKTNDNDKLEVDKLPVNDKVESLISGFGYTDTAAGLLQSRLYPRLNCKVSRINLTTVSNDYHMDASVEVELQDPVSGKSIVKKEFESQSGWKILSKNDNPESEMLVDAVADAIAGFLNTDDVHKALKDSKEHKSIDDPGYAPLTINRNGASASNLREATAAVVTIKTKSGHGSGSVISNDGYIISNLHVVADQVDDTVEVIYADGSKSVATVLRQNAVYDLCLLRTAPVHVQPLRFDTMSHIDIGEEVYAIGTPAEIELGQSLSKGIISGKRMVSKLTLIQSDVSINPGNSGGAMVTREGELIGVVNSKIVGAGMEGLGFAIPASMIGKALGITVK